MTIFDFFETILKVLGIVLLCVLITIILTLILKKLHLNKHIVRIPLWLFLFVIMFGIFEIPFGEIYKYRNSICQDPSILGKLKNDKTTTEFVLDGEYYSLPCSLKQFINNGWINAKTVKGECIPVENLSLDTEGEAVLSLATSYGTLSLIAEISSVKDCGIENAKVIGAFYISNERRKDLNKLPNTNFFVTKNGITETTEFQRAREIEEGLSSQCIFVMKYDLGEGLSSDIYGNFYGLPTSELPDNFLSLYKYLYNDHVLVQGVLIPSGRAIILEKKEYTTKRALSYNEARWLLLAALIIIPGIIACPIVLLMYKHRKRTIKWNN